MAHGKRNKTVYYENETEIKVIEEVDNAEEYIQDRAMIAKTMGYTPIFNQNKSLDIYLGDVLIGTYFHENHMN